MQHPRPSDLVGLRLSVEVPAVGDSVNVRFEGEVKNVARKFVNLSTTERAILEVLSRTGDGSRLLTLA